MRVHARTHRACSGRPLRRGHIEPRHGRDRPPSVHVPRQARHLRHRHAPAPWRVLGRRQTAMGAAPAGRAAVRCLGSPHLRPAHRQKAPTAKIHWRQGRGPMQHGAPHAARVRALVVGGRRRAGRHGRHVQCRVGRLPPTGHPRVCSPVLQGRLGPTDGALDHPLQLERTRLLCCSHTRGAYTRQVSTLSELSPKALSPARRLCVSPMYRLLRIPVRLCIC